jgi:hypothetical protein
MKSDDQPFFRRGGEPKGGTSEPGSYSRLDSWEEIAAYLRRSVRSARRWEKEEGLPVHHDVHRGSDSVYAYTEELDDWWMKDARMAPCPSGRLDSWKEIAAHLHCSVRSVRRWEKEEGLPVRRHVHEKGDSVYAFQTELDDWLNNRSKESGQGRTPKKSH